MLVRVRVPVEVREDDGPRLDPEVAQALDDREAHRPVFGVDAHRCSDGRVRRRGGREHVLLERRQPVVARSGLDDPAAGAQVGDEQIRERVDGLRAVRAVRRVVHVAMEAGRRDDVQPGGARDGGEPVEVAPDAERSPVHERPPARLDERARFRDRLVDVREVVARLRGRGEKEVLMRIAGAELARRDVPENRPDDHAPRLCIRPLGGGSNASPRRAETARALPRRPAP